MKPIETAKHVISAPILAPPRVGSSLQGSSPPRDAETLAEALVAYHGDTPICPSGANNGNVRRSMCLGRCQTSNVRRSSPWCWP